MAKLLRALISHISPLKQRSSIEFESQNTCITIIWYCLSYLAGLINDQINIPLVFDPWKGLNHCSPTSILPQPDKKRRALSDMEAVSLCP